MFYQAVVDFFVKDFSQTAFRNFPSLFEKNSYRFYFIFNQNKRLDSNFMGEFNYFINFMNVQVPYHNHSCSTPKMYQMI